MVQIVTHGTLDYAELAEYGLSRDEIIVFSSNVNPFGPPDLLIDAVAEAVSGANLAHYPDRLSGALREMLADYHGVEPETVVVGNGTADLMWLIALLYLKEDVAILGPTFGEYENLASMVDVSCQTIALPGWQHNPDGTFAPSERSMEVCLAELAALQPKVVFLCNPNNPTGELFTREQVAAWIAVAPDALWIIDEAYMEFVEEPWSAAELTAQHRIIVLRSMTKDFALGGVRLGYLVADVEMARKLQTAQPPWNVNIFAQVAGEAAMQCLAWRAESMAKLRTETRQLRGAFVDLGLEPRPTTTNYFLTPVDAPTELREFLLKRGVLIRDCTSFGLVNYFRVATQQPRDNARLIEHLRAYGEQRGQ